MNMNEFLTRFATFINVDINKIAIKDLPLVDSVYEIIVNADDLYLPHTNGVRVERDILAARAIDMYRIFERAPRLFDAYALHVNVYRSAPVGDNFLDQDCSLGGVTSKYPRLIAETVQSTHIKMFEAMMRCGIEQVLVLGTAGGATHYKPATHLLDGKWHMFGGNFVYTSDSRFASGPVAVHDRVESY